MNDCFGGNGTNLRILKTPARNKYFFGKLMEECHFEMEQDYFNRKRWLLNRLALGYGVLSGLDVKVDTSNPNKVVIHPGVAIDPLGREIIVPAVTQPIDPTRITADDGRATGEIVENGDVWIGLAYLECPKNPVPALVQDCGTQDGCMPSTICEQYIILVRKEEPDIPAPTCPLRNLLEFKANRQLTAASNQALAKVISNENPIVAADLRTCVPLARIHLRNSSYTQANIYPEIRPLVFSNAMLFELLLCLAQSGEGASAVVSNTTQVSAMNWGSHGKNMAITDFLDGLDLTFDHPVKSKTKSLEGLFVVTLEEPITRSSGTELSGATRLHQLAPAGRNGITLRNDHLTVKPKKAWGRSLEKLLEQNKQLLVRVTVKCSLLTDADDPTLAVDGSGNGVPGSDFTSWFYLTAK
ncbi:MAG: hypothetical protein P8Z42_05495 [Anaerolineales bacterium]